ncbi:unnamed protein product [Kuraishia capsulata CBS 1993]|uniref:RNB domain-containing protein n=1 Tax=Kuraishia capsulata CBS 1993 TaxID=1382522 RepID=W6MPH8_9ASCO|nr:uncharacterized protein KUCA_T00004593001 [Kuraishia capsulata CBS 1993]CDK28609.1 unnamed protein product [Kuraishia capsulata CBS 1993]
MPHQPKQQSFGGSGVFGQFQAMPISMPPPSTIPRHKKSSSIESGADVINKSHSPTPPPGLGSRSHRRAQSSINAGSMGNFSLGHAPNFKATPVEPAQTYSAAANPANSQARGHSRRHSLGLNEARRAAAMVQMQRAGDSPPKIPPPASSPLASASSGSSSSTVSAAGSNPPAPPSFKFPATPVELEDNSLDSGFRRQPSHSRSRSALPSTERSPQRQFQFPARENSLTGSSTNPANNLLVPPNPNFAGHRRRQSGNNFNSGNTSNSWRKQHTPQNSEGGFVQGHRSRFSYGGSVSSMASFSSQGGGSGPQRKNLFTNYLPQSSLSELISEGKLVVGTLRVNKKNRSDAYVSTDGVLDADIFICGSKDRNRSLEGDLVAVELLVVDEVWNSKKEKEEKKRRKNNNNNQADKAGDDLHNDAGTSYTASTGSQTDAGKDGFSSPSTSGSLTRRGSLKQRPTQKKNDDVEVEGQSLLLVEEEEISDEYKPLYAGQVVAIVERTPGQCFSGTLMVNRPSQQNFSPEDLKRLKIVWFKPTDKKVPLIAIPVEQAPKDFIENEKKYSNQLFVGLIKRWPISSLHPFGNLVSQIGAMNEVETEISAILCDNNFMSDEYSEGNPEKAALYLKDIPDPASGFVQANRRDFTREYVIACTQTGSFCDHALHVKRISETKIELGVHFADTTFFIKQDSFLDKMSRKRSHSVFLPQRAVHLLPEKLNELISFKENEKGLSMSVVFAIDTSNFEINNVWMGEAVVLPKQKIDYASIDYILGLSTGIKGPQLDSFSSATADYVRTFSLIAREFRRKRLFNPTLENEPTLPLIEQLDDEKVKLSLNIFDPSPSTSLIDEIFHTVNVAVAQKIHAGLGDRAFLRRNAAPTLQKIASIQKKIDNLGVQLDTTMGSTVLNSILNIKNPVTRECIETILVKCMPRGKYAVAGTLSDKEDLVHYLFNVPIYTHFTAPLRRYADLIVHRQLKAVLKNETDDYPKDLHSLKEVADFCNFKKDCAKSAQEQAIHLILCQTINDMSQATGHLLCMGVVIQVYESAFDVFLPEFGIEKRVHGDQLPLRKAEFDKKSRVLELFWEKGVDSATYVPADENEPLSYRNSIKNKFRSGALDVAKVQSKAHFEKSGGIITETFAEKLAKLGLTPPKIIVPVDNESAHLRAPLTDIASSPKSMPNTPVRPQIEKQKYAPRSTSELEVRSENSAANNQDTVLNPYLQSCITRVDGDNYIQEIRELKTVPILLRAEIGMALPCLTVRTLNPFSGTKTD